MDTLQENLLRFRGGELLNGILQIAIEGRLDSNSTGRIWLEATQVVAAAKARSVKLDASAIDYCDGSGIGRPSRAVFNAMFLARWASSTTSIPIPSRSK